MPPWPIFSSKHSFVVAFFLFSFLMICLSALKFNLTVNNPSVISWQCLDVTRKCPFYSATSLQYHTPDILMWHNHQSYYTDTGATSPSSACATKEQLVSTIGSLRYDNSQLPDPEPDTLSTKVLGPVLTLLLLNTTCPVLANWSGSALFVIKYVNFYQKLGSSNLIGWKLEVGVALIYSEGQLIKLQIQNCNRNR